MNFVKSLRRQAGVTQEALAQSAGTSQPTIAAYEAGKKSPTVDTLQRLAASVGLEPSMRFHPSMSREDRRSIALHRAIARRLVQDPDTVISKAKRNLATMRAGSAHDSPFLREWAVLLDRPVPDLVSLLEDPAPWARELRQVTPFAGVLSTAERTAMYRGFRADERRRTG